MLILTRVELLFFIYFKGFAINKKFRPKCRALEFFRDAPIIKSFKWDLYMIQMKAIKFRAFVIIFLTMLITDTHTQTNRLKVNICTEETSKRIIP